MSRTRPDARMSPCHRRISGSTMRDATPATTEREPAYFRDRSSCAPSVWAQSAQKTRRSFRLKLYQASFRLNRQTARTALHSEGHPSVLPDFGPLHTNARYSSSRPRCRNVIGGFEGVSSGMSEGSEEY